MLLIVLMKKGLYKFSLQACLVSQYAGELLQYDQSRDYTKASESGPRA